MKRATLILALILLFSCFAPVAGYYFVLAAQTRDVAGAAQQFLQDAAGGRSDSVPDGGSKTPAPQASFLPDNAGTPKPADTAFSDADTVKVKDSTTGEVLEIPMRDYLIGAVASEMPMTWQDDALQAQAVATHSYLLYCRDHSDTESMGGAWLEADPARRQGFMTDAVLRSYWGTNYDINYARLSALVDEVLTTIITYDGQPAATSYFAISNGRTEASQNVWDSALPYLQGVDSAADKSAEGYTSSITYTGQQMYDAIISTLGLDADSYKAADYFSNYIYTDAGYVYSVDVCGQTVRGNVLRSALHLRSSCFSIQYADGLFTITTQGYGHGIGLSQAGAEAMAESGSSWQDILTHYFPGTSISG